MGDLSGKPPAGELLLDQPTVPETEPRKDAATDALGSGEPAPLPIVDPGDYAIEGEHARGGIGRILRAHDRHLGRLVALKELLRGDAMTRGRFVREALLTARLEHPAIVPVHEAGRWPDGRPFYTMKMISGRPLAQVIQATTTLDERLALLPNLIAVAEAMAYAHGRRVIHRDLKPANVLVGAFGETVVVDWGLAKDLTRGEEPAAAATDDDSGGERDASDAATQAGSVLGTPSYMAPEQARGEPVDERADVYALGALLYCTLAGGPPYGGGSSADILSRVVHGPPPPITVRQPGVPRELGSIIVRAMARDPAQRYPSAKELAADLVRFQAGQLVASHRYSTAALLGRWLRRHRLPVAVAAVALALLAAVATISVRRIVRERDRADRARDTAEAAVAREARRVDELTIAQARAAVDHDPTAALAWLKRLRTGSPLWSEARGVAAAAQSRGPAYRLLLGHREPVADLAWSPDGARLATAGGSAIWIWDAERASGRELRGHDTTVRRVTFSTDGARLTSASSDGQVWLWDLAGDRGRPLALPPGGATDLAFVAGELIAAGADGTLRRFRLPDGALVGTLVGGRAVTRLLAAGDLLVVRDEQGVRVLNPRGGHPRVLPGAFNGPGSLALSDDGRFVAAGAPDSVAVWEVKTLRRVILGAIGGAPLVALSRDGARIATAGADGTVQLWDRLTGRAVEQAHRGDPAHDLLFSSDGALLAATRGATVRVWRVGSAEPRKLRAHELDVARIAFSPDGRRLATVGLDRRVAVFRLDGEEPPTADLPAWLDRATNAAIGRDDRLAAVER